MHKTFDFKKYVEYKVYSVTTIKKGYGFRVLLTFADESTKMQQHAGFTTKREANAFRDEVIGQLHTGTYIVYGKIRVEEFMIFWLEDIMRPRITDDTYTTYKSAIRNYIVPQLGKMYMSTLNQILRVPKVVMQEVKRRQQLIELRKTDPGIEYKNFDYVCCQENGEPRSLTAMNQALTKICNRNGLANITVHGLRHMFATILIELGVPLFKISGLLGHSSVHTTYEYYCEIMDEQDKIIAFVNNTFVPQQTGTEG